MILNEVTFIDKDTGGEIKITSEDNVVLENNEETRNYISQTMENIIEKENHRKLINEEIQNLYMEAEFKGINRRGLKVALARYKLSPLEREGMDDTYSLCCILKNMVAYSQIELFSDDTSA